MNWSAAVFMTLSWLLVLALSAFCFVKVLRDGGKGGGGA